MELTSDKNKLSFLQRHHVILKAHYFLFFGCFGVIFPVLSLILRAHGLSNTEISVSNILSPFLVFITSPLAGFIADKSRRFRLTFNIIFLIVSISFTAFFLLPHIKYHNIQANLNYSEPSRYALDICAHQEVIEQCSSRSSCGCSYKAFCNKNTSPFNFTFTVNLTTVEKKVNLESQCDIEYRVPLDESLLLNRSDLANLSMTTCDVTCSVPFFCYGSRNARQMNYVLLHSILFVIGLNLFSSSSAVGTSIGFLSLSSPQLFGSQRVWGTIGFGIVAFSTSLIHGVFNSDYVYIIMFNILSLLTIIVTSFIPIHLNQKKDDEKKEKFNLSTILVLLKDIDVVVFLSVAFLWGMSFGCLHPYVGLYVDEIAPCKSRSIIGILFSVASISEIIAFYSSKWVIQRLGTNITSVIIFLAFATRFSGYYFILQPEYFFILETMHFFNFGILYVLIAQRADLIAPPGLSSTLQGITHGVLHGFGCGTGLVVSSIIYIAIQRRLLFLVFAIANVVAAALYSIYFLFIHEKVMPKSVTVLVKNNVSIEEDTHLNQ